MEEIECKRCGKEITKGPGDDDVYCFKCASFDYPVNTEEDIKPKIESKIDELREHSLYLLRESNRQVDIIKAERETARERIEKEIKFLESLIK